MNNNNYTICESYTLPSLGKIYGEGFDPHFKIRSMTTQEEMKRLSKTDEPYKLMSEIIEDCLIEKFPIPVCDLCLGDYQFLLHKLRTVTYGADYKMSVGCPICGHYFEKLINLDELEVKEYNEETFEKLRTIHLPQSNVDIELNFMTPRIQDAISLRKEEIMKKSNHKAKDPTFLLTLTSLIKTVDGKVLEPTRLESFVTHLPMKDTNILMQSAEKLNGEVGLNNILTIKCEECDYDFPTTFRITSEFFGPSID